MDVYITEADGYPVSGAWSTFEKATKHLVKKFGIDTDELKPCQDEENVWSAPGDMGMMSAYITKMSIDQERP